MEDKSFLICLLYMYVCIYIYFFVLAIFSFSVGGKKNPVFHLSPSGPLTLMKFFTCSLNGFNAH